ncbi:MAG: hypothetical protein KAI73_11065 [Rhodospirillaceae bacterium]|nr:hypothetical protein [Rhodospirillaceae bacterium]
MNKRKTHTLDELLTLRCASAGVVVGKAVQTTRDEAGGRATFRLPPIVLRRSMVLRVSPAQAYVKEHAVDADAVMARTIGPDGEDRKDNRADALKAHLGIASDAEFYRRAVALLAQIFDTGG